jgi:hypothetical protein
MAYHLYHLTRSTGETTNGLPFVHLTMSIGETTNGLPFVHLTMSIGETINGLPFIHLARGIGETINGLPFVHLAWGIGETTNGELVESAGRTHFEGGVEIGILGVTHSPGSVDLTQNTFVLISVKHTKYWPSQHLKKTVSRNFFECGVEEVGILGVTHGPGSVDH